MVSNSAHECIFYLTNRQMLFQNHFLNLPSLEIFNLLKRKAQRLNWAFSLTKEMK